MTFTSTLEASEKITPKRPSAAPWLRSRDRKGTVEEARLRAEVATLRSELDEKDLSIEFLHNLLSEKWFSADVAAEQPLSELSRGRGSRFAKLVRRA